jgi:hypothetical protein
MTPDDARTLADLQVEHPGWRLWRPRLGTRRMWCATRVDGDVDQDRTLIEDSAELLRTALREQPAPNGRSPGEAGS